MSKATEKTKINKIETLLVLTKPKITITINMFDFNTGKFERKLKNEEQ